MEEYLESVQVIKEKDKRIVIEKPTKKTVLFCLNGFQNSDTHDATPMMDYFVKKFGEDYPCCEVVPVHLFYPAEVKTHHHTYFEKQIDTKIKEYVEKGYDILIMGYSFSAALASKMACRYKKNVTKLILVAPVYDTVLNGMIPHYIGYAHKFNKLAKKYGARMANAMGRKTTKGLFGLLVAIFSSILINRHYIRHIHCPTLVIRGLEDTLCSKHSVKKVMKGIKAPKSLYKYPGMTHGILKSLRDNGIVYEDILNFAFDTPFLLEKASVDITKQEVSKIKYDEDGERIPSFNEIFSEIDPDCESETRQEQEGL